MGGRGGAIHGGGDVAGPDAVATRRTAAFLEAAECALEEDARRAKTAGKEAIETASRRTIVSPAESRAMAAAAARAHFSADRTPRSNPPFEPSSKPRRTTKETTRTEPIAFGACFSLARRLGWRSRAAPTRAAGARPVDALAARRRRLVEGRPALGHRSSIGRRSRGARCRARGCRGVGRGMGRGGGGLGGRSARRRRGIRSRRRQPRRRRPRRRRGRTSEPAAIVASAVTTVRAVPGAADASRTSRGPRRAPRCSLSSERSANALESAAPPPRRRTLSAPRENDELYREDAALEIGAAIRRGARWRSARRRRTRRARRRGARLARVCVRKSRRPPPRGPGAPDVGDRRFGARGLGALFPTLRRQPRSVVFVWSPPSSSRARSIRRRRRENAEVPPSPRRG